MPPEESVLFYEQQQAYRQRREDFNQEVLRWFENYKPKHHVPTISNIPMAKGLGASQDRLQADLPSPDSRLLRPITELCHAEVHHRHRETRRQAAPPIR